MATWVKCTRPDGQTVFVNMDRAVSMSRVAANPTTIGFDAGQEVIVKEIPERIIDDDFEDASEDDD